ncbi:MAG: hypothetical protein HY657_13540 [Acidobacteria bacterium]|nr:hypothetical protein [Acidobacteriota bacterium]
MPEEKNGGDRIVNPFKLIGTKDKTALRPYLAAAVSGALGRPLAPPERLLAAKDLENPVRGAAAALLAEAILEDAAAAASLRDDDPALFAAAESLVASRTPRRPPVRKARGPRPRLETDMIAALPPLFAGAVNAALPISSLNLSKDIEGLEDLIDAARDVGGAVRGGTEFIKELRELIRRWREKNQGNPGAATDAESEEQVPYIVPDEFTDLYGESTDELEYSVWLDRVGAFEVDGAGADNVYWVAQSFVHMREPNRVVVSATISQEYDLDEFEEARLPPLPDRPGRGRLVDNTDWKVVEAIRDRDAILAIRQGNRTQWFPLSRLRHIELFVDVYESDHSELAEDAIAAIISAVVAALAFFKGKVTPSVGSTAALTSANQEALRRLFRLINSDDLLLAGVFNLTQADFEDAFDNGTVFPVRDHRSDAAANREHQRRVYARGRMVRSTIPRKPTNSMLGMRLA